MTFPIPPLNAPDKNSRVWHIWFDNLRRFLSDASGLVPWSSVNKSGAKLTDIPERFHNSLQAVQGGAADDYYHLTVAQLNDLTDGGATVLHKHAHNLQDGLQGGAVGDYYHLTATHHTDLTDGGDSALHFHSSDRARANHTGTQESSTVLVARIGSPTYTTLQHYVNLSQSSGRISGGALSDAGGATINVAAGTGWLRVADDDVSDLKFFDWAASNGNAIPAGTVRYVGVEYNAGSPQVVIKTTDTWNEDTEFQLGEVFNESGALHIINNPFWVGDSITNIIQRFDAIQHVARDNSFGGLSLGETGTRNVTVTAGHIWSRLNDFHFDAFNSSTGGTFDRYYRDGAGGFTREAAQTQWPNTQYDDGSGVLVTMTNNRYANLWFYAETDGDVVMLYGQAQYTSASAAEVESPPTLIPGRLTSSGLLIGRIIFQKSSATATTVSSAFTTVFNPAAASDHNLLSNLQGGAAAEYYHLTNAQHTDLTDAGDSALHFHASDRARANHTGTQALATISDVTMTAANLNTLDDGANTALHFHDADRARANHTGTQTMATISDLPVLASGTYTPTLTHVANVSASTAYQCQYLRVGNVVTVSGKADVDPTTISTSTMLGISLPIASNLGAIEDCGGTTASGGLAGQSGVIRGDIANNRAEMFYVCVADTNTGMFFTFTYEII